jgi:PAS domain S-box-containing protein
MIPLAQLIDNTADGGFAVDYSLKISAWNRAATSLFGFTPAEALGLPCYEVIAGRDDGGDVFCQQECAVLRCAKMNDLPPNCDICTRTKAGQAVWLNVSIVVVPPSLGTRGHLVHIFRPIDRQKRLEEFVRLTLAGGTELLSDASPPPPHPPSQPPLSSRELEILRLLSSGAPTRGIAQTLGISHATVRTHSQNILGKLGVHSKLEAVLYAVRQQLLPQDRRSERI